MLRRLTARHPARQLGVSVKVTGVLGEQSDPEQAAMRYLRVPVSMLLRGAREGQWTLPS